MRKRKQKRYSVPITTYMLVTHIQNLSSPTADIIVNILKQEAESKLFQSSFIDTTYSSRWLMGSTDARVLSHSLLPF